MDKLRLSGGPLKNFILERFGLSTVHRISPQRSTCILRRRTAPFLSKQDSKIRKTLTDVHSIYQLVEDTNEKESPDVSFVLTTFVEGVGDIGDVMSAKADYVRNHLLLPRKAVYATPEYIEYYSNLKKTQPERPEFSSIYAGMTVRFLSKKVVPVYMNSVNPWEIKTWHIRAAFRLEGIIVPEDALELPQSPITGPDPMKEGKDFSVTVTINNTETVPVRCRLFQLNENEAIAKLSEEFYLEKREAVLPEQEDLLDSMPMPEIEDNRPESNISMKEKYRIKFLDDH